MTTDRLAFSVAPKMLILGCLLFMVAAALSTDSICDLEKDYPIRNESRIVGCLSCRFCHPGLEPAILCGTEIDNNQSVGNCRPCRNGTFSPAYDQKPCRTCQRPKCLKHEIVMQNCTDTYDDSRCSGSCDSGFFMNKEKTECKMQNVTTTTQPEQKMTTTTQPEQKMTTTTQPEQKMTTTNQPQHEMTTTAQPEQKITTTAQPEPKITPEPPRPQRKNTTVSTEQLQQNSSTGIPVPTSNETKKKAVLPVVAIIVSIVIGLVVVAIIAIVAVCKKYRVDPRAKESCSSINTSRALLQEEITEKFIMQEEGKENAQVMKKPEHETGFGADASATDTPSSGHVLFGVQESEMSVPLQSPCPASLFQQPEVIDDTPVVVVDPRRPDMILGGSHAAPPGPPRVAGLGINAETYETICNLLSDETVPNNWKKLAGHMGYDNDIVKQFTTAAKVYHKYPAAILLEHWSGQSAANDVAKLKELAGQIKRDDIVQLLEQEVL